MPRANTALQLVTEISSITAHLVEKGLVDDQNTVTFSQLPGRRWIVAQNGADMSLALKKRPYLDVYEELVTSGNYAMHLLDGALVQFNYSGDLSGIDRHRLAYLPAPNLEPYQNDPDLYFGENHFVDIVGHQVMPVAVRFDFDARDGVAQDVLHPVSHLTLGQYQHCRIPVTKAVTPSEFMTFVLSSFYSTPEQPQTPFVSTVSLGPSTITSMESARVHMMVP